MLDLVRSCLDFFRVSLRPPLRVEGDLCALSKNDVKKHLKANQPRQAHQDGSRRLRVPARVDAAVRVRVGRGHGRSGRALRHVPSRQRQGRQKTNFGD